MTDYSQFATGQVKDHPHSWQEFTNNCVRAGCYANSNFASAAQPCPCPWRERPPQAEAVTSKPMPHAMNCAGSHWDGDCTCGLNVRIALETERTMHAAWRKRAEEAEAELRAMRSAGETRAEPQVTDARVSGDHYGKDCPRGKVQVEFVGCGGPENRYSNYGWMPADSAFVEIYVDGERYNVQIGSAHYDATRRGLHIIGPIDMAIDRTASNSATLFKQSAPKTSVPQAECICPTCGLRHGGSNLDGGF